MNKKLKLYVFYCIVFVSILGTISHFLYEWSGNNQLIALFTPTNESVWEHIKLLYFPMLIYVIFVSKMLKSNYPNILSSMLIGIIIGFMLIPTIFYVYSGVLGYNLLIIDISSFYASVLISFWASYKLTILCNTNKFQPFFIIAIITITLLFFVFTYHPPSIALFNSNFS